MSVAWRFLALRQNVRTDKYMIKHLISVASLALASIQAFGESYTICAIDPQKHEARAKELQDIYTADQADRANNVLQPGAQIRDRERRARVGSIFGEGCFKSAEDYRAAAMVFQHGDRPDHYWQTFVWSQRGVELGDIEQRGMVARGLDRYLVETGHKQLFASQAFRKLSEKCFCLRPVEPTFPDTKRVEYMNKTLAEQLAWVDELNRGQECPSARQCNEELKDSPAGTVPGFW